jgi:hypothetical protein
MNERWVEGGVEWVACFVLWQPASRSVARSAKARQ